MIGIPANITKDNQGMPIVWVIRRITQTKGLKVMTYINVGVTDSDGRRIKTKKALKEMVADNPNNVYADSTGMMGRRYDGRIIGMPEDVTLSVTGPDPYRDRKWYASITRKGNTITVK